MPLDLTDAIVTFACENCDHEIKETIGSIRFNNKIRCSNCHHVDIADISEIDRQEAQLNKAIRDSQKLS